MEGGKPENLEKNPWSEARRNNELNPHVTSGWYRTWNTLLRGEHSDHCTIPAAPPFLQNNLLTILDINFIEVYGSVGLCYFCDVLSNHETQPTLLSFKSPFQIKMIMHCFEYLWEIDGISKSRLTNRVTKFDLHHVGQRRPL